MRSINYPLGVPHLPRASFEALQLDNHLLSLCCTLLRSIIGAGVIFWADHPSSSWLWHQRPVKRLVQRRSLNVINIDRCMWGSPWQKSTRFIANLPEPFSSSFCSNHSGSSSHFHTRLRGRQFGSPWTRIASQLPASLANAMAVRCSFACGWRTTDINWQEAQERALAARSHHA